MCHGSLRIVAGRRIYGSGGIHSFGHTLRFYIRQYGVKWSPVSRADPLVSSTASRPRVYAAGLMQSGLRRAGLVSRRRYPVADAPYAPPTVALVLCWRSGFGQLLRKCFWSVACGQVSCVRPAHPGPRSLTAAVRRTGTGNRLRVRCG